MKTSNINIHDMLSVWRVEEVEKHISEVPGVESVTVNFAAENATVRYDETHLDVADIKSAVRQRSYESFAQEQSTDKPAKVKAEASATPPSEKPPEEKDKPETKSPVKAENPDMTPPTDTAVEPAKRKEEEKSVVVEPQDGKGKAETKSPANTENTDATPPTDTAVEPEKEKEEEKLTEVKPTEEKNNSETNPTAIEEKKEEDSSGMDHSKMDHSKMDHSKMEDPKSDDHSKMDHSKMSHNDMKHSDNPSMGHAGHDHHAMMIADFKKRFYIVLGLTIPIMLLSTMIQQFMGVDWQFAGSSYILFGLSTVVFIYGGWPFLKGLVTELKDKNPGMMTLIGFAISVA
ncbi:cation transporter, partial [Ferruginibacter sp.]|uniref:cation transporter n=1 Tax=Ferruginibacter sp. TaxID=1940288 RepID=UPI0019A686BC